MWQQFKTRGVGGHYGCRGCQGCVGGWQGLWALMGQKGYMGHQGLWGISRGHQGVYWGGKWTGSLTTLGPSPGSQHSHWFPWGSDLPSKAKQVTEMRSAGYYIDLELYFVVVFTFVSMPPHHIFLHAILRNIIQTIFSADQFMHILTLWILMYYDTLVVIMNNYFSHQISELVERERDYVHIWNGKMVLALDMRFHISQYICNSDLV